MTSESVAAGHPMSGRSRVATAAALGAGLLWASWPSLREMAWRWSSDPRYTHGFLVPLFALALLWLRRGRFAPAESRPSWWGLVVLAGGVTLRLTAAYYYFEWLDAASLLPCLAGIALLLGGWTALRWSWPSIGFLAFMLPLPFRLEVALAYPLQRIATLISTFSIQTVGLHALAEGSVIVMDNNVRIGVVEACNGLGMLMTFFAIATGFAIVIQRPLVDKALIVLSAVPIAVLANVTRITATAIMHVLVGGRAADIVFHDLAGWLMTPLAMAILLLEIELLSRLLIEREPSSLTPIFLSGGASAPPRSVAAVGDRRGEAEAAPRRGGRPGPDRARPRA